TACNRSAGQAEPNCARPSASRSMTASRAPSARKREAQPAPMPDPAPVIITTFPSNRPSGLSIRSASVEGSAAIDGKGGAGHIRGFRTAQPENGGGDLIRLGDPSQRITGAYRFIGLLRVRRRIDAAAQEAGLDRSG